MIFSIEILFLASCMVLAFLGFVRLALVVIVVCNSSMAPTLNDGDRVLVLRYWPSRWLRKGQIVLICPPWPKGGEPGPPPFGFVPFIKRVVGLPGETLLIQDVRFTEIFTLDDAAYQALPRRTWHIPAEHLFVCGDNPRSLADSRFWGPIPTQRVVAIMLMPLSRATRLDQPDHPTLMDMEEEPHAMFQEHR